MTTIQLDIDHNIATLTLKRPEKHNALNTAMIAEITQVLDTLQQKNDLQLLVIKAQGKHFCAGADLNDMRAMVNFSKVDNLADAKRLGKLFATLDQLSLPTLCLVQGAAFGGALGLIACSDIVIAADDARFCFSEVRLGLAPATIAPYVIHAIGMRQARRYFLTAERFSAQTALKIGLVHEVVKPNDLDQKTVTLIEQIRANSINAMHKTKQLIHQCGPFHSNLIEQTEQLIAQLRTSADAQTRLKHFLEK